MTGPVFYSFFLSQRMAHGMYSASVCGMDERQTVFLFYEWRNRDEVTCAESQSEQEPGNLNLRLDSQHFCLVATSDCFV